MSEKMWEFSTKNFHVIATVEPDENVDVSFDDTNTTRDNLESGKWTAFATWVRVYYRGAEVGSDCLGGSIYEHPRDFFSEHRGSRGQWGSYFPDMVRQAIKEARKTLANTPRIRATA